MLIFVVWKGTEDWLRLGKFEDKIVTENEKKGMKWEFRTRYGSGYITPALRLEV